MRINYDLRGCKWAKIKEEKVILIVIVEFTFMPVVICHGIQGKKSCAKGNVSMFQITDEKARV